MHSRILLISLLSFCFVANLHANECLKVKKRNGAAVLVNKKPNGKCPRRTLDMSAALTSLGITGPKGDTGPSGTIKVTTKTLSTVVDKDTSGQSELALNFGDFTKNSDTSILKITLTTHIVIDNNSTSSTYCSLTPRIDSTTSNGLTGNAFSSSASGTSTVGGNNIDINSITTHSMTSVGIFKNVTSGSHNASIWIRTLNLDTCSINKGGFTSHLVIEEIEPQN